MNYRFRNLAHVCAHLLTSSRPLVDSEMLTSDTGNPETLPDHRLQALAMDNPINTNYHGAHSFMLKAIYVPSNTELFRKLFPEKYFFGIFEEFCPLEMSRKARHFKELHVRFVIFPKIKISE